MFGLFHQRPCSPRIARSIGGRCIPNPGPPDPGPCACAAAAAKETAIAIPNRTANIAFISCSFAEFLKIR
jgi:hypothetical protein